MPQALAKKRKTMEEATGNCVEAIVSSRVTAMRMAIEEMITYHKDGEESTAAQHNQLVFDVQGFRDLVITCGSGRWYIARSRTASSAHFSHLASRAPYVHELPMLDRITPVIANAIIQFWHFSDYTQPTPETKMKYADHPVSDICEKDKLLVENKVAFQAAMVSAAHILEDALLKTAVKKLQSLLSYPNCLKGWYTLLEKVYAFEYHSGARHILHLLVMMTAAKHREDWVSKEDEYYVGALLNVGRFNLNLSRYDGHMGNFAAGRASIE